jgi:NodT family efflux transporter outer membrane factor (OMF) lipoprotein
MRKRILLSLSFVLVASAAKRQTPQAEVTIPPAFANRPADAVAPEEQWWKSFGDPFLDRLIDRAGRNNLDLRKAAARLAEAEASRRGARAQLAPEVSANGSGVKRQDNFLAPAANALLSTGFQMRWELDVFRGLSNQAAAARADAQAANENLRDVLVIVRADVARSYIDLRAAEDQLDIVRATIASEEDLLRLIRSRAEAGLATELDVERQIAQLASFRAVVPDLDATRANAIHRIGVLLGEPPAALQSELEAEAPALKQPAAPGAVPTELLKRRPDLRRAEATIAAAFARAGAARSDLYPKLVITGLTGRQAAGFDGLTLGAGNFFSVGPGVSLPIFNFGRIRSNIAVRDAQLEQAVHSYEQEILAAFEETENAFVARDRSEQRSHELNAGLTAAKRSVEMARELYAAGLGDFLTVLDAQREEFAIERDLASANAAGRRSTVALYKALGL